MTDTPAALAPRQLEAYFAFMEVGSLLRHAVEKQLKEAGDVGYVQFQLLARLGDTPGGALRMTDLADGVVYSRSGLTYQAQLLEQRGLVVRAPSPEDERGVVVTLTDEGRATLAAVFPGHIEAVRRLLFAALDEADVDALADILGRAAARLRSDPPRSAAARRRRPGRTSA
ncbi:MarR family winged helix-turn-helix transcriptional regulator [Microbacterium sp. RURRCA19A]|uniref:MarR family winged helix-turn-helix transcriptional regulator n=1 Tax=Microbacterium sp. RURRCA19A TaxID=1907391 RepID=UPI000955DB23|nr:MarR family transcriptional regulator [Microbacterium sp. RURRCA19A]SIR71283.1 DNA-binding transcriptional regulator, MarR family [Microbacterium sp. RURRCA19A]